MRRFSTIFMALCVIGCAPEAQSPQNEANSTTPTLSQPEGAGQMEISRAGSQATTAGPAEYFTGAVAVTPLFATTEASQVGAALVRFEAGARTAWHSHPKGQRLIVTEGTGLTQIEGGEIEEIRVGDVVTCPPNVRHWHGASPGTSMTHIAIHEAVDGSPVTWMEQVTDQQYQQAPS